MIVNYEAPTGNYIFNAVMI